MIAMQQSSTGLSWLQWGLGSLVTIAVAAFAAWYGGRDLRKQARRLTRYNDVILAALERAGLAEFGRDENNEPTLIIDLGKATSAGKGGLEARLDAVDPPRDPPEDPG